MLNTSIPSLRGHRDNQEGRSIRAPRIGTILRSIESAQIQQGNAQGTLTERATYTLLPKSLGAFLAARDCSRRQTPILRQL